MIARIASLFGSAFLANQVLTAMPRKADPRYLPTYSPEISSVTPYMDMVWTGTKRNANPNRNATKAAIDINELSFM
jgi:hypothetical protein